MEAKLNWLLKLTICLCFQVSSGSSVHLYSSAWFKDYLGSYDLGNKSCINLPSLVVNRVASFMSDNCKASYSGVSCHGTHCMIGYSERDCQGYNFKFTRTSYPYLHFVSHSSGPSNSNLMTSIGRCKSSTSNEGAHVQFYYGNELILDIRNLCKTTEISPLISRATSIKNNENCIILHQRNKTNITLLAGKSYYSEQISKFVQPTSSSSSFNPIIAISPCYKPITCEVINLSSTVLKFSVNSPAKSVLGKTTDFSMAATTKFINDGWATVSQEYKATKTITEATDTTLVNSFSKMNNWNVGASVEFEVKAGFKLGPIAAEASVKSGLSTAYTREEIETREQSKTIRQEVSKEFSVSEKIEIEPCTTYTVDSYLRVKERLPLQYTVTFEITGKKGDASMTAKEIRQKLGNLNYIRDKNSYTVVASENSEMYVDYGVETVISGAGEIIVECRDKQLKTQAVVKYLNVSINAFNESLHD